MGRKSEKTKFPDRYVTIQIRLKGKQKNEIVDYARAKGYSVNEIVLYAVWQFIQNEKGIPDAGSPQFSITTVEETVLAYIRGEQILKPCGQKECTQKLTLLNEMQYCTTCNLRIL